MRILPRKALVNLSDIISEVGGVIDCGSNGERKSGRPDINIPCQFSVCLLARCSGTLGINTHLTFPPFPPSHFCLFFSSFFYKWRDTTTAKSELLCIIHRIYHSFFPPLLNVLALVSLQAERREEGNTTTNAGTIMSLSLPLRCCAFICLTLGEMKMRRGWGKQRQQNFEYELLQIRPRPQRMTGTLVY